MSARTSNLAPHSFGRGAATPLDIMIKCNPSNPRQGAKQRGEEDVARDPHPLNRRGARRNHRNFSPLEQVGAENRFVVAPTVACLGSSTPTGSVGAACFWPPALFVGVDAGRFFGGKPPTTSGNCGDMYA